jgi:hypothetical protein
LRQSRFVVPALNGVADIDHEIGVKQVDLAPDAAVDLGLGAAGSVAQDGEPEIVFGFLDGAQAENGQQAQHQGVDGPELVGALHTGKCSTGRSQIDDG